MFLSTILDTFKLLTHSPSFVFALCFKISEDFFFYTALMGVPVTFENQYFRQAVQTALLFSQAGISYYFQDPILESNLR